MQKFWDAMPIIFIIIFSLLFFGVCVYINHDKVSDHKIHPIQPTQGPRASR
jgi:hypothetical protein